MRERLHTTIGYVRSGYNNYVAPFTNTFQWVAVAEIAMAALLPRFLVYSTTGLLIAWSVVLWICYRLGKHDERMEEKVKEKK